MQDAVDEATDYLRRLGEAGSGPHDIATAALMFAVLDHPAVARAPYAAHLSEIADRAREDTKMVTSVDQGARLLAATMTTHFGYEGDRITYDDPQNADLMAVIDRRRGLPVALGILYIHAARAAGFAAQGLQSPGHFLLSILHKGREALVDPFNGGAAIGRESLGAPPRMGAPSFGAGPVAEPVSDIDVLLRLQNNVKLRANEAGDYPRALQVAERMVLIGPKRPELWLDLARLYEPGGALGSARKAYETCLGLTRPGQALHNEAALGLNSLKRKLN
jgi:regulator of sirC expression with transglutaminase-like and TPR domain